MQMISIPGMGLNASYFVKNFEKIQTTKYLPLTYTLVTKGGVKVSIPLNGEHPLGTAYLAMRPQFLSAYLITPIL
mgnify:CR=1 FL=1